jgi:hypothetical protein
LLVSWCPVFEPAAPCRSERREPDPTTEMQLPGAVTAAKSAEEVSSGKEAFAAGGGKGRLQRAVGGGGSYCRVHDSHVSDSTSEGRTSEDPQHCRKYPITHTKWKTFKAMSSSKNFQESSSHRMFRHMHRTLNIDEKN